MVDSALSHLRSCLCREADAPSDQVGFRSLGSGQGIRVVSLVSLVATGCLVSVAGLLRGFLLIIEIGPVTGKPAISHPGTPLLFCSELVLETAVLPTIAHLLSFAQVYRWRVGAERKRGLG